MVDYKVWSVADPLTIEQAACLWADADPSENSFLRSPQEKSQVAARMQMLSGAISKGVLKVDDSANALRVIGDHKSNLVLRETLEAFAVSIGERPAFLFNTMMPSPVDSQRKPETEPVQEKNKGGRRPEWNWDAMHIEIYRVANSPDGLPETQAELVRHLQIWFSQANDAEPAESEIKARVSRIYNGLGISRKLKGG